MGKGHKQTKEHIEKVRKALIGIKRSEETKLKIKNARKNQIMLKGEKHPRFKNKDKSCIDCKKERHYSNAKKMRCKTCYIKFNVGKNHTSWKGGYKSVYPSEFNTVLKLKIRQRDNFTCCLCKRTEREELEELNRVLCVNHIDFDKNNCKESNLNTLCIRCNVKINRDRDYWTNYFNQ